MNGSETDAQQIAETQLLNNLFMSENAFSPLDHVRSYLTFPAQRARFDNLLVNAKYTCIECDIWRQLVINSIDGVGCIREVSIKDPKIKMLRAKYLMTFLIP